MNLYLESAKILKSLEEKKGTLKNLVYANQYKNKKKLQAFLSGVVKVMPLLKEVVGVGSWVNYEKALKTNQINKVNNYNNNNNANNNADNNNNDSNNNNNNDHHLVLVCLFEFLFGASDQLPNALKSPLETSSLESTLSNIRDRWGASDNQHLFSLVSEQDTCYHLPRYVRVNTLHLSTSEAIEHFKRTGFRFLLSKNLDYNQYLNSVAVMKGNVFMRDVNVQDLLVFPHGTSFFEDELFNKGDIILQDKASCLSALALNPPPASTVVDACAAPGNKTSYLAALMQNEGKIYALDMDPGRFGLMQTLLKKAGVSNVEALNLDFLSIFPKAPPYKGVHYILVDPSCSGSGIANRQDIRENEGENSETQHKRIRSLSNFQAMTLNHALKFPKAIKVVYSTCSVHREENEEVVREALTKNANFELEKIFTEIPSRGINGGDGSGDGGVSNNGDGDYDDQNNHYNDGERYDMSKCLRMGPNKDLTNGFFIASFIRKNTFNNYNNNNNNKYIDNKNNNDKNSFNNDSVPARKRKKRNRKMNMGMTGSKNNNDDDDEDEDGKFNENLSSTLKRKNNDVDYALNNINPLYKMCKQTKKISNKDYARERKNIQKLNNNNDEKLVRDGGGRERKLLKKRIRRHGKPIVSLRKNQEY